MGSSHSVAPGEFSFKPGAVIIMTLAVSMRETVLYLTLIYDPVLVDSLAFTLHEHTVLKHALKPVSVRHSHLAFDHLISLEASFADHLQICDICPDHNLDTCRLYQDRLSIPCGKIVEFISQFIITNGVNPSDSLLLRYFYLDRLSIFKLTPEYRAVCSIKLTFTMRHSINTGSLINGTVLIYLTHAALYKADFSEFTIIP